MQVVKKCSEFRLKMIDLSALPEHERALQTRHRAQQEAEQPFDLATGPLLRAALIQSTAEENVLVIAMHHIVSDGWSMGVFLSELATLYEAFSEHRPSPLPEISIQYADYAVWQRDWLQGEVLEAQVDYWRKQLGGVPATLELAADRPRPAVQTFQGARRYIQIPAALADRLRAFSRREGVTLFMTLLAAFEVLLWKRSGQEDIVVGTPIAGRNRSELEGVIGYFANTLPLRTILSGNPSFRDLLKRVREVALEAQAHQDVPFDKLVEELRPERSLSHTPLFQIIFAFENTPQSLEFPNLKMKWLEVDRGTARTDLSLFITDKGAELSCMWEYTTDLFDSETIERMEASFQTILENILENPEKRIGYLETLSQPELRQLHELWTTAQLAPAKYRCMQELFEAQVERTPDALALVFDNQRLSYREVNARANQLAHYLQKLGVGP